MAAPNYPPTTEEEKTALLQFIRTAPMGYGTWRDLKGLYKRVEADPNADPSLLGAFAARFDAATMNRVPDNAVGIELGSGSRTIVSACIRDGILYALTGSDNYASRNFRIYDLAGSDLMKPTRIADLKFADGQFLQLCGDYAIAVTNRFRNAGLPVFKLTVFDVSDPRNPRQRGEVESGGSGQVVTRYPYVFTAVVPTASNHPAQQKEFYGLRVVSIADPDNPRVVAELQIPRIKGLLASDNGDRLAVVVEATGFSWRHLPGKEGVRIFDVSVATNPREIGSMDLSDVELGGGIYGNRLYVPAQNRYYKRLAIYDLSNPGKPRHLTTWKHINQYNGVDTVLVQNAVGYVTLRNGGMEIIDVRDPTNIISISTQNAYYWGTKQLLRDGDNLYFPVGDRIRVWNVASPERVQLVGVPPSPDTIAYMKRRVRRVLRNLSKANPTKFAEAAFHALTGSGAPPESLNTRLNWVTMDLLYGGGTSWYQQSHGRGGYTKRKGQASRITLRRREERAPSAWDTRPELAESLLKTPHLPYQTHEFAARVLRTLGRELPTVTSTDTLQSWLSGESLLLQSVASRSAANILDSKKALNATVTALAYFRASRFRRSRIERAVLEIGKKDEGWRAKVGAELSELLQERGLNSDNSLNRRGLAGARFLGQHLALYADARSVLALAPGLLQTRESALIDLVTAVARQVPTYQVTNWIGALSSLSEQDREPAMVALEQAVANLEPMDLSRMALYNGVASAREMAWRLLAASATSQQVLFAAWSTLLDQTVVTDGLRTAMASPYALSLLERAGITNEQIAERLQSRPFLAELISRETFASLVQQASAETLLRLTAAMPDTKWEELRGGWLRLLQEGVGLTDLWRALPGAVDTDETGRLIERILENEEYADALLGLGPEEVETALEIRRDPFDTLLRRWLERREAVFTKDSGPLLQAATHELNGVRTWGLERARALGFGLPFALRLLECEIPASMVVGREFFTNVPPGGDRELDYALALCDSPILAVRRLGREFVTGRWQTLPQSDLLRALFENPDPESQAFVSERLTTQTGAPDETGAFHADVLRQRNRSRKAKEAVKKSEATTPAVDTATLLELARGSATPRDAEWALSQLARRALAGEQIPGFSLDGVAG